MGAPRMSQSWDEFWHPEARAGRLGAAESATQEVPKSTSLVAEFSGADFSEPVPRGSRGDRP